MCTSIPPRRWYVVQCKAGEDCRALQHLERQGFPCYRPTVAVEKIRSGRKVPARESLFPGYLFVQLDPVNDHWQPIRSTRGVIQIVRCRERPLPMDDKVIDLIRERLSTHRTRIPYLEPGDRVVVTEGCFSNVEAIFLANDGDERVILLLNILSHEQKVSFPVEVVKKERRSSVALDSTT